MDLVFSTGEPGDNFPLSESLRIRYNSNIGIGTNNPQQKLSVKGKIQAEEIKFTTTSTDWPDYVFEEDYRLNSLKDLEIFIKTNKHLPDMPTANEVELNGVQLGEIVKKLLKNNDELTLHVISLQKPLVETFDKTLDFFSYSTRTAFCFREAEIEIGVNWVPQE